MKYFERIIPNRSTETLGLLTSHKTWSNKAIWIDYCLLFYNSDVLNELNSLGIPKNSYNISIREFLKYKGGPSPPWFPILKLFDFFMLFSLESLFSEFFLRFLKASDRIGSLPLGIKKRVAFRTRIKFFFEKRRKNENFINFKSNKFVKW